jgi:glycosyltransferase involved in cell wall biosynthesis
MDYDYSDRSNDQISDQKEIVIKELDKIIKELSEDEDLKAVMGQSDSPDIKLNEPGSLDLMPLIKAKSKNPKYKICLNMIVKNESKIIVRLIETVKDVIDYYIISDTGSTDNTISLIKRTMKKYGIPGEVPEVSWRNFAYNRQVALEHAYKNPEIKYVLIIDADEELRIGNSVKDFKTLKKEYFNKFDRDCYHLKKKLTGSEYFVPMLINTTRLPWIWKGVVHEYLDIQDPRHFPTSTTTQTPKFEATHDYVTDELVYNHVHFGEGANSHGLTVTEKYLRDAKLLEAELEKNPTDTRSMFYLAQSYYDAQHYEESYKRYKQRAEMGGWDQEVYYSLYRMGVCTLQLNKPYETILSHMMMAYEYRPIRMESLFELCKYCREHDMFNQGYLFGKWALSLPPQKDLLFVHQYIYDYALLDQLSLCAYYTGRYQESKDYLLKILKEKKYPAEHEQRYRTNLEFSLNKLRK